MIKFHVANGHLGGIVLVGVVIVELGERLKMARKRSRLTQKQVADELGVDRSTHAHWERGSAEPDSKTLSRLAAILNTTVGYLLGETSDLTRPNVGELALHHADRRNNPDAPISDSLAKRIRELQDELGRLADEMAERERREKQK